MCLSCVHVCIQVMCMAYACVVCVAMTIHGVGCVNSWLLIVCANVCAVRYTVGVWAV